MLPPAPQVRVFLVRLCGTSEEKKQYQQAVQACAHLCSAAASPLVACVACRRGNHPLQPGASFCPPACQLLPPWSNDCCSFLQAAFGRWSQQVLGAAVVVSPQKSTVTASGERALSF